MERDHSLVFAFPHAHMAAFLADDFKSGFWRCLIKSAPDRTGSLVIHRDLERIQKRLAAGLREVIMAEAFQEKLHRLF